MPKPPDGVPLQPALDIVRPRWRDDEILWLRFGPYFGLHLGCLLPIWVGWSTAAVTACAAGYLVRMFFITGFYHRYFCHRAFRTTRVAQFVMAALGCTAAQRGPIWWSSHHRLHHKHADEPPDPHSPRWLGILKSHMGWFMTRGNTRVQWRYVRDWVAYPELRWLERRSGLPFFALVAAAFALGEALRLWLPNSNTSGLQMTVWVGMISTVALYHGTYTINSLAHSIGWRRFDTKDDSRNSLILALVTLGEGWHNNHHYYPASARQGFRWWEIDLTYYVLCALQLTGIIWSVRDAPSELRR